MPIRVSDIRLRFDESEAELPARLARTLGVAPEALRRWRILRKSLDARNADALQFVYAAEVSLPEDEEQVVQKARRRPGAARIDLYQEPPFEMPPPGAQPLPHR